MKRHISGHGMSAGHVKIKLVHDRLGLCMLDGRRLVPTDVFCGPLWSCDLPPPLQLSKNPN